MTTEPPLASAMVHEAIGRVGALPGGIRGIFDAASAAGPAFTVETAPGDNSWLHHALAAAPAGSVIVCGCGGAYEYGYFGEVMATAALSNGIAGLVIDGKVRDLLELQKLNFPVFSRGICIRGTGKGNYRFGGLGVPVSIGDAVVRPGDLVVADRDGVAVADAARAGQVASLTEARAAKESRWLAEIGRGVPALEVLAIPSLAGVSPAVIAPGHVGGPAHV
jgi:4-hydroxy-4-methyl-2-oxoglutarate aldolase